MFDADKLRRKIKNCDFHSRPTSTNSSDCCTVKDLNAAVESIKTVLLAIVDELEASQE